MGFGREEGDDGYAVGRGGVGGVDDPGVGLSHVNLLGRLGNIDTEEVRTLKVRVFNGEISYRELAAKVRAIQEGAEAAAADICLQVGPPERILGRKRAKSFEWTLEKFLTARLKDVIAPRYRETILREAKPL